MLSSFGYCRLAMADGSTHLKRCRDYRSSNFMANICFITLKPRPRSKSPGVVHSMSDVLDYLATRSGTDSGDID